MGNDDILDSMRPSRTTTENTASKGKRVTNAIIDTLVTLPIGLFVYFQFVDIDWETGETSGGGLGQVLMYVINFGYYFFMEGATGKTIGKMITGTKVLDANGERPSLGKIALRSLCRFIPFEFVSFFGPKSIGLHDSLSKTYVVPNSFDVDVAGFDNDVV